MLVDDDLQTFRIQRQLISSIRNIFVKLAITNSATTQDVDVIKKCPNLRKRRVSVLACTAVLKYTWS